MIIIAIQTLIFYCHSSSILVDRTSANVLTFYGKYNKIGIFFEDYTLLATLYHHLEAWQYMKKKVEWKLTNNQDYIYLF
jgi:hypothetical protein